MFVAEKAPILHRAAVLGAGVMGRAIAAHLANSGLEVLLLDMPPSELSEQEQAKGLSLDDPQVRNRLAVEAIASLKSTKPAPLFRRDDAQRIKPGNFDDDLHHLADVDWVIEAVVERLDIKQNLFERVEAAVGDETILSTNTSGIPVGDIAEGRSDSFRQRFLGTHFFNPPRYMHLLEVIPGPDTQPEVLDKLKSFADERLGKGVVLAKDEPNFIANRIGAYGMLRTVELMMEQGLGVDAVESLTGTFLGRAKSATFRTADLVGLDVLLHVAANVRDGDPDDPEIDVFTPHPVLQRMVDEGRLGGKTGQGFYKKEKVDGKSVIKTLNLETFEYQDRQRAKFPEIAPLKGIDSLTDRLKALAAAKGKGAEFAWAVLRDTLRYAAAVAPEVAHDLGSIDRAMRWGFGWQMGPFEIWDALGLERVADRMEKEGRPVPAWVKAQIEGGARSFYKNEDGEYLMLGINGRREVALQSAPGVIDLKLPRPGVKRIDGNSGASLWDLGDDVLGIEWHSKMNTVGGDVLSMTLKGTELAERDFAGVVVGNQGQNFSVGANLALLLMAALEGEWEDIDLMIRQFQKATTSLRRCARPVVVAPFNLTLGGGCEFLLHGDKAHASAELYTGLVEGGVGLIPAGAGSKEFYVRMLERLGPDADPSQAARLAFETIGMAKVSTSAEHARSLGFLRPSDSIAMNPDRLLAGAKAEALALAAAGYTASGERTDIPVSGDEGRALLEVGLYNMWSGHYISDHDRTIGRKLARIITGGDVKSGSLVTEAHLLELERQEFLSLCGERKSLERIQHTLKTGKPLRN